MALYKLESDEDTVHSFFSADLSPIMTIDPGDTVRYRLLEASASLEPPRSDGSPRRKLMPRRQGMAGHALCGPIAIRGAKAGMTLGVQIGPIEAGTWGWTYTWSQRERTDDEQFVWSLDPVGLRGRTQRGQSVALRPFLGVMGMPPPQPGNHSTEPPRLWGGNLDCKALIPGSTLYLPIPVDGALFSTGDGHAAQGDGEVSGTAIECPIERAELTFTLYPDLRLTAPRAETPEGYVTFGVDADLNVAAQAAVDAMIEWMTTLWSISRMDALLLATVAVDVRVGQMCLDTAKMVYAVLPHGAIDLTP